MKTPEPSSATSGRGWPLSAYLDAPDAGPVAPTAASPVARLGALIFASADAATAPLAGRLLRALASTGERAGESGFDAADLCAAAEVCFGPMHADPRGVMGLVGFACRVGALTRANARLHITEGGHRWITHGAAFDALVTALSHGGGPGLVIPERLWIALCRASAPPPRDMPPRRWLLARCLDPADPALAARGLDALTPAARAAWLDHVDAAALCVAEHCGLLGALLGDHPAALEDAIELPPTHPWAPRGVRPTPAGLRALIATLTAAGSIEDTGDVPRLAPSLRPLLADGAPLRRLIARLRHRGVVTPDALRRALDRRRLLDGDDPMTAHIGADAAGFHGDMAGLSAAHARSLATDPALRAWLGARGVDRLISLGPGSGIVPLALHRAATQAGAAAPALWLLDIDPRASAQAAAERIPASDLHAAPFDFFADALLDRTGALGEQALVELGNVLHDWTPAENRQILRNIAHALPIGARTHLAITERYFPADFAAGDAATWRLHQVMQVWTRGQQYRVSDLLAWLRDAGLAADAVRLIPGADGFATALLDVRRLPEPTLMHRLRDRARDHGDDPQFSHLIDGDDARVDLDVRAVWRASRAVAAELIERGLRGERVLLLYPPGPDYAIALFGCFLAGAIAVPDGPPDPLRPERSLPRLAAITRDARAAAVLTVDAVHALKAELPPALRALPWIATDAIEARDGMLDAIDPDAIDPDAIAYLQYTSGSTADPKGVVLTHRHLVANCRAIEHTYRTSPDDVMVSWVPTYHDLGLVYAIAMPVFVGMRCVSLSPAHFARRPERWLRALSRARGTLSIAPDTAYAITASRVDPATVGPLDLSGWRMALNGAEPVHARSERAFAERFAEFGFRATAFSHSWGLSEATAKVTGERRGARMQFIRLDADALARHRRQPAGRGRAIELASCGTPALGTTLRIVDPDTAEPCPPDVIGEVWVSGPSVGRGYFEADDATAATFGAHTADGDGPYLRTGDRGFLDGGRLFVTGRIKEIIIVRGQNHYPQDLEATLIGRHPALRPGGVVVGGVTTSAGEGVCVIAELRRPTDAHDEVVGAITTGLAQHGLRPADIALVEPRAIPRTSSNKPQRRLAVARLRAGELGVIHRWSPTERARDAEPTTDDAAPPAAPDLLDQIRRAAATTLGVSPAEIPPDRPLTELGFDSAQLAWLAAELERRLGQPVSTTLFFDHPSPLDCAAALTGRPHPAVDRPAAPAPAPEADDPVVVCAMACRLPGGVDDPEALWAVLRDGVDCTAPFPTDRGWPALFDPDPDAIGRSAVERGGFIDGIDRFDAPLFHISPREATSLDPQQRILLELAWQTFERAGLDPRGQDGQPIGVYVGLVYADYEQLTPPAARARDGLPATGFTRSIASGRIAYTFGLHGPALTIDTACSASLVAVHQARVAIERGECALALVGGATTFATPDVFVWFSRMRALAPDGRSKPFAAAADGATWSEGAAMVLLARQSEARRRGLPILARVVGSAVNQDGRTQGLTAPNGPSQQRVIRAALDSAGLRPDDVDLIEAHGTGTRLGDPIEAGALLATYGQRSRGVARLGAIKSNLGHTQAAAGLVGLIKLVLALRAEQMPPTLHVDRPTPHVDWSTGAIELLTAAHPWPRGAAVRRGAVSSFGLSGTNAHVIVEEAARPAPTSDTPEPLPLLLSARTDDALRAHARRLARHFDADPPAQWRAVAATLALGRATLPHRLVVSSDGLAALTAYAEGGPRPTLDTVGGAWSPPRRAAARRWLDEGVLDRRALLGDADARRVALPTYPFERRRYWPEPPAPTPTPEAHMPHSPPGSGATNDAADLGAALKMLAEALTGSNVELRIEQLAGLHLKIGGAAGGPASASPPPAPAGPRRLRPLVGDRAPADPAAPPATASPPRATPPSRPTTPPAAAPPSHRQVGHTLRALLAEVLCVDDPAALDPRAKFVDLGLDSVVGVEFVRAVNRALGVALPAAALYDSPTLDALTATIGADRRPPPPAGRDPDLRAILERVARGELAPNAADRALATPADAQGGPPDPAPGAEPAGDRRDALRQTVAQHLRAIRPDLADAALSDDAGFEALGLDSVDRAELLTACLEALGCTAPRVEFSGADSIGALVERLARHA